MTNLEWNYITFRHSLTEVNMNVKQTKIKERIIYIIYSNILILLSIFVFEGVPTVIYIIVSKQN